MKSFLVGLMFLSLGMGPALGQDEGSWKKYESSDGSFGIRLPASWNVTPLRDTQGVMAWKVSIAFEERMLYGTMVVHWVEAMQIARSQPFIDRPVQLARYGADEAEIGMEPLPHLEIRYGQDSQRSVLMIIYRVIQGRGLSIITSFNEDGFESLRKDLFESARSISTTLAKWPPDPEGYDVERKRDYRYLIHPSFKGSLDPFRTFLYDEEKRFTRIHGPLNIDEEWLPALLMHGPDADFFRLLPAGAPRNPYFYCDTLHKRLFCRSLPKRRTVERAVLAREMHRLFFVLRYGTEQPRWLCILEGEIAYERALTGKKLPTLSRGRYGALPRNPRTFAQVVETLMEENFLAFIHHCLVYGALFRGGDKAYRDAFQQFLDAFHETGDWKDACQKHLLSLDPEALREAAARMVQKKLKPRKE